MKVHIYNYDWIVRENTSDVAIIHEVYNNKLYDLTKFNYKIQTCLDIGAHIGSFTNKVKQYFPECKIWSYEPIEENFELLCLNTSKFKNVFVNKSTVSGNKIPNKLILYFPKHENKVNTGSNIFDYELDSKKSLIYENTHICEIQNSIGYIDLLKIDCEGGEHSIFENINFDKIGSIMIELHKYSTKLSFEDQFNFLDQQGFKSLHKEIINDSIAEYFGIK